jgi:acyl-CoA synthetase (AMP-forming)/AMP-acid ligase II/3-hydroxymyristoyl/3-hydroxydecanoyl-(acyl carrier protein) dehydratase
MLCNKLSNFLLSEADSSLITSDGVTLSQLKDDVARARSSIKSVVDDEIVLYESDAYRFLVWTLAAWQEGRKVLVPVDISIALNPSFSDWFKIGEFDDPRLSNWGDDIDPINEIFHELDPNFDALGVFTSGSTGDPVRIDKKIWQLENEVEALEYTFGESIPRGVAFIRSVSHQHFFGMPFALFWAISRGSKITRQAIKGGHEWNTSYPQVLVTSPSFLKSIVDLDTEHKNIGTGVKSIFSAGGVLDDVVHKTINQIANTRVVDIYGSSETGHIAWRSSPDMPWALQRGVEFKKPIDEILEIKSKFCPNDDWFSTSDLAHQLGNSFEILGRADRILKIEGTRISLSQLINAIKGSDLVEDCQISDLEGGRRSQLGCVIKLNSYGCLLISTEGKLALINNLKNSLRGKVNAIAIPRRWRFVDKFPQNAMGKVIKRDLDNLFSEGIKSPIVVSRRAEVLALELVLDMSKTLACFNGHFDGFPVVPGVALIEWAIKYSQEILGASSEFIGMSQVKFQGFIKPNQIVRLKLDFAPETMNLKFKYHNADAIFSSGILKFADCKE